MFKFCLYIRARFASSGFGFVGFTRFDSELFGARDAEGFQKGGILKGGA